MNVAGCRLLGFRCARLPPDEHVLTHAIARLVEEIAAEDQAAGLTVPGPTSGSSIVNDGTRMKRILADEGWRVEQTR